MKVCPLCNFENPDTAYFCQKCGQSTGSVKSTSLPQLAQASPKATYNRLDNSSTGQNATAVTKDQLLEEYLRKSYTLQKEIDKKLGSIKGWITFIGVLIIIGLVATLFGGCLAML